MLQAGIQKLVKLMLLQLCNLFSDTTVWINIMMQSYSVYMRWLEMPYIIFRFMCNPKIIPGLTLDTLLDGLEPSPY